MWLYFTSNIWNCFCSFLQFFFSFFFHWTPLTNMWFQGCRTENLYSDCCKSQVKWDKHGTICWGYLREVVKFYGTSTTYVPCDVAIPNRTLASWVKACELQTVFDGVQGTERSSTIVPFLPLYHHCFTPVTSHSSFSSHWKSCNSSNKFGLRKTSVCICWTVRLEQVTSSSQDKYNYNHV